MPYYDVANLVTVTDKYDRRNGLWLWNHKNHCCENTAPSLLQSCAELHRRSQLFQNLTILQVNSWSILNAPPSLQVRLGAPENALAESENTLLSSSGAWEQLEVLRSTGEVDYSVWEIGMLLPDRFTFCWWDCWSRSLAVQDLVRPFTPRLLMNEPEASCMACTIHGIWFLNTGHSISEAWSVNCRLCVIE